MNTSLTQAEADALLAMEKHRVDMIVWKYPDFGKKIAVPLKSADGREHFFLDLYQAKINLGKRTFQNRGRKEVILARLDFGPPHRNPDGQEIGSPHIHLYKEGFDDKWAFAVSPSDFPNLSSPQLTLRDFMRFCNVVMHPFIHWSLSP